MGVGELALKNGKRGTRARRPSIRCVWVGIIVALTRTALLHHADAHQQRAAERRQSESVVALKPANQRQPMTSCRILSPSARTTLANLADPQVCEDAQGAAGRWKHESHPPRLTSPKARKRTDGECSQAVRLSQYIPRYSASNGYPQSNIKLSTSSARLRGVLAAGLASVKSHL